MAVPTNDSAAVRPTKRCLDDLGVSFPPYTESLSELSHPLVRRAQSLPQEVAAGGAERIRSLRDRVWFKCKTSVYRGAVTLLAPPELESQPLPPEAAWWIGAAGTREEGSGSDFYAQLEAEATRRGKGTGGPSTEHLLPQIIDRERLKAEIAARTTQAMRNLIVRLIANSLQNGRPYTAELQNHRVTALVRASEGTEAYLAIAAEGFVNPEIIALILNAVPGIRSDDWQPEPGGVAGIVPDEGQIIWSTIIPPEVQAHVIERFDQMTQRQ